MPRPPDATDPTDDTPALTRAVSLGNRDAFTTLYTRHADRLVRAISTRTGRDESFALDVMQDTMIRAARSMPPLPSTAALDAWLRRVAYRVALDTIRAESRRARRERSASARSADALSPPSHEASENRALSESLAQLEAEHRWLLEARYGRGLAMRTLADALDLTAPALESRLRRLLVRLRAAPERRP